MSCGKPSEEIIGRSVEGNEEVLTVRKICHHNPAEEFETIQSVRIPIVKPEVEESITVTRTAKVKAKQELFRDDLKRAPRVKK